jgi:amino acid transporter
MPVGPGTDDGLRSGSMVGRQAVRRRAWWILALGVALSALYIALRAFRVGQIGAPTDIGGGLILLAGYALSLLGLVAIVGEAVARRRRR